MRRTATALAAAGALAAAATHPAAGQMLTSLFDASTNSSSEPTVITSETMDIDMQANTIVLTGSVEVDEPTTRITADKMTVTLAKGGRGDQERDIRRIVAEGRVVIKKKIPSAEERSKGEQKATAGRADYDVEKGTIVLSDSPALMQGKNTIQGDRITLWRDSDRMKVESDAAKSGSKGASVIKIHESKGLASGGAAAARPPAADSAGRPQPAASPRQRAHEAAFQAVRDLRQAAQSRSDAGFAAAAEGVKASARLLRDHLDSIGDAKDPGAAAAAAAHATASKWMEFPDWKAKEWRKVEACLADACNALQGEPAPGPDTPR